MVRKLTAVFVLFSSTCFAQNKIEYANFIKTDTAVKWAAIYSSYVNLTSRDPNFNLLNFYINKLKSQGSSIYLDDPFHFAVTPVKADYTEFKETIKPVSYDIVKMNWYLNYDAKHTTSEALFKKEANGCDSCLLANRFSFFKVKQLLYYRNNQFKIQNILISPVIYKKDTSKLKEETEFFEAGNLAFNEAKIPDVKIPPKATFIGRSCNDLTLLPSQKENMMETNILTPDNWSLSKHLYNDIQKNKLKAYATDRSIYPNEKFVLSRHKLKKYKAQYDYIMTYDSTGKVFPPQKIMRELNLDSLYNFTIIQDFYFDFDKEVLYSKLVALFTRRRVYTFTGQYLGLQDFWGVIFPKEKKDIVKKKKYK